LHAPVFSRPAIRHSHLPVEDDLDGQKDSAEKSFFPESFTGAGSSLGLTGGDESRPQAKLEPT
jgi:hypothetical protein